jgi:uncharacterized protein DUF4129
LAMPPGQRPRMSRLWLGALAIILLILVAAALPEGIALSSRRGPVRLFVPDLPDLAAYLAAAVGAVLLITYLLLRMTGIQARGLGARKPRRALPMLTQVAIVMLAILVPAFVIGPRRLLDLARAPLPPFGAQSEDDRGGSPGAARPEAPIRQKSQALGTALTILLVLVLMALVAGAAWLFWPERRSEPLRGPPDQRQLIGLIEAGIEDLEQINDPRAAICACYSQMERLLAAMGTPRRPTDTPLELMRRALMQANVPKASVSRLTELFHIARFSHHAVDEGMRQEAITALRELRRSVAMRAPQPTSQ